MSAYAARMYKKVDLESAPKTQILDRLFARFDLDLVRAGEALAARDIQAKAAALDHALQIVIELRAALDHGAAPELCANLAALYDYVVDRLTDANLRLDPAPLASAQGVMAQLREAFAQTHGAVAP
ncbi:MAG: flagellar export chaperone FliS [Kofleriaceae bacterium]|jgi:flagellar protein FliS|nr:flagellar export chaperone FliS [Kofleriaceae bacterium]MBP9204763.1 flagellar export chaperone FliS [Kofleriaceae bacterium]